MKTLLIPLVLAIGVAAHAQAQANRPDAQKIRTAEREGIDVRIKDIARFRGVRGNQITGIGLVVGLEGTGDTRRTPFTSTLLSNAMKEFGTSVDAAQLQSRNVAVVTVTAELPPFASPGNTIDVTVQSIGDAKSLQGGFLLQTPLYAIGNKEKAFAVAMGAVSIGGFNASSGGASVQRNHVNVGRIPGGAFVERGVDTKFVFDGALYLELDEADLTTAQRLAEAIGKKLPTYAPVAMDGGTIRLALPEGTNPVAAMSAIEATTVKADIPAVVVVNERTGTIVIGGQVKLGPAVIAHGGLQVVIDQQVVVSQPAPLSQGQTVVATQPGVTGAEEMAQVALVPPSASIDDLSRIFQTLKLSPRDIIAILQALRDQGSLKARIKVQ